MRNTRKTGARYEELAAKVLTERGYWILEKNFRCPQGEIDIVARKDEFLVFVEVKYRSSVRVGFPEEAVGIAKQKRISRAALWYLTRQGLGVEIPCRFDVVAICGERISVYEDAFYYQP